MSEIRNIKAPTGRGRPRRRVRNANQCGDPVESERLRPLFLRWVGKRSNAAGLKAAGIEYGHGTAWLAGHTILRSTYQTSVRRLLDEAGIAPSPAG